jgi:hypothetical protein
MSIQTKFTFTAPTNNDDGTPITLALTYVAQINGTDYPFTATPDASGTVIVLFSQLAGFTPVKGTKYTVDVVAIDADGSSSPSATITFVYNLAPNAPTGLKVS